MTYADTIGKPMAVTSSWEGHYMEPAFKGFVVWASSTTKFIKEFEREAGQNYETGYVAQDFVDFCETRFGRLQDVFPPAPNKGEDV